MSYGALNRRVAMLGVFMSRRQRIGGSTYSSDTLEPTLRLFSAMTAAAITGSAVHMEALAAPDERKLHIINHELVASLRGRLKDLLETSEEAQWLDDGDFTLHRFLVSRGCNLDKAELMFRGTVAWRSRFNVRGELDKWRDGPNTEERKQGTLYGYAARAGFTDAGVPVNVERVGKYDIAGCVRTKGMTDLVAKAYIMYLEETFQDCRRASKQQQAYVRGLVVQDANGVGLPHLKNSGIMREVIKVGQQNYPELIEKVLVVRAPLSMYTLWNFGVKWMLPERVKNKVTIVKSDFEPHLAKMGIVQRRLPVFMGGALPDSLCPAMPVPSNLAAAPVVSRFGRVEVPQKKLEKLKEGAGQAISIRESMGNIIAWASSSAN